MNSVEGAECYVIHVKPFKDTSAIVEFLSRDYGRVSVVFKGVRNTKGIAKSRILQPFQPLLVSWSGARELKSGRDVEQSGPAYYLMGKTLFSGMYVNELLMRLLYRDAPAEGIMACYEQCLSRLRGETEVEYALRQFEWDLLDAVGYQIPCNVDCHTGDPIANGQYYRYDSQNGFRKESMTTAIGTGGSQRSMVFTGELLLAMANGALAPEQLADAKRLMRAALAPHLGAKPLESKKLFMVPKRR